MGEELVENGAMGRTSLQQRNRGNVSRRAEFRVRSVMTAYSIGSDHAQVITVSA